MKIIYLIIFTSVLVVGCTTQPPTMTQLQKRQIQTREYDTNNTSLVMKAMVNVLQDEDFIIKEAVLDFGVLYAEKQIQIDQMEQTLKKNAWKVPVALLFPPTLLITPFIKHRKQNISVIDCSINVSESGDMTRVRANFQWTVFDNKGAKMTTKQILEQQFYQTFFSKVDKGIFLAKEKI